MAGKMVANPKVSGVKYGTVIFVCEECRKRGTEHQFQDTRYGMYNRVGNYCKKGMAIRCTVCLAVKDLRRD